MLSAAGFVLILSGGCGDKTETRPAVETPVRTAKAVTISPAAALPPRGTVEYVGLLSAFRKAEISSEMGGTIERFFFEKGDRVKKNQVLAEVSTDSIRIEVQQAAAALKAAESQLEKTTKGSRPEEILMAKAALQAAAAERLEAEKNVDRIKTLYGNRAVSDSVYDSARRAVDMARAKEASARQGLILSEQGPREEDRQAAKANVEQAQAGLALAKDRLRKSRLVAPFSGVAAFRDAEQGEVIPPGMTITRIVDLSRMKIKLSINEKDIAVLKKHPQLDFSVDALAGETYRCWLVFLSPTAAPSTRSFPAELLVADPDPRMADGMTARVRFPLADENQAIKIPSAWLAEEDGNIGLYVVENGKALFRAVTLGDYYDQRVQILKGLDGNEQVITNPTGIKSGDTVTIQSE
ncbi:MAG: efflux RND transporter periplasmic adaptor subunit [Desulfobacterales bacterium]|nr:efflux RND transporter periplasmic adaptor subunit [Desulfobacterales bacterium]